MQLNGNNLKIAVQKQGRLTQGSVDILKRAGFKFESGQERLFTLCQNFPLEILFVRDDDIPEYVCDCVCDLGIVGLNVIKERKIKVKILANLGFAKCSLKIAVPADSNINQIRDLTGRKIATSYPRILSDYLRQNNIQAEVLKISGSVEIAPSLGVADAICDLSATGSTLKTHDLISIADILESQAVLISQTDVRQNKKNKLIQEFLKRIRAVLEAEGKKYILLNAPRQRLAEIIKILPSAKSPTIMPLQDADWVAVHSVVPEEVLWFTIDKLKQLGGQGILVLPIEQMVI
jgi:ATP phosphoribosyltransferase